jgi:hypothetical protein
MICEIGVGATLAGCVGLGDQVVAIQGEIQPQQPQAQYLCTLSLSSGFRRYEPEPIEGRFERLFIVVPGQPAQATVACLAANGATLFSRSYAAGSGSQAQEQVDLGIIRF